MLVSGRLDFTTFLGGYFFEIGILLEVPPKIHKFWVFFWRGTQTVRFCVANPPQPLTNARAVSPFSLGDSWT